MAKRSLSKQSRKPGDRVSLEKLNGGEGFHERRLDLVRQQLHHYNRTPFLNLLAMFMEAAPTPDAIAQFAREKPDRWAQAIAMIAKIAGFAERQEIDHTISVEVNQMSDAQLMDRIAELQGQLQPAGPPLIEACARARARPRPGQPQLSP